MSQHLFRAGQPQDLPELRRLLQNSSRSYLAAGIEDVASLLAEGATAVAVHPDSGQISACVALQREEQSSALPVDAPEKVAVPGAAVAPGLFNRNGLIPPLVEKAIAGLKDRPSSRLLSIVTDQRWLLSGLELADFRPYDEIRFYERTRRNIPSVAQPAELRPVQEADLAALARLDAETFEPLWHMSAATLLQLCFTCHFEVAYVEGQPVGYAALSVRRGGAWGAAGAAQLVRLAVHPQAQGQGIGRQLLVASLAHAHGQRVFPVHLNTQESNRPSQRLYESLGFRKRGRNMTVLVRWIPADGQGSPAGENSFTRNYHYILNDNFPQGR